MDTTLRPAIENQTADESCYWILEPERDIWIPEYSNMTVWLEESIGGVLYIFRGNERSNATQSLIEKGMPFVIGAPLILPIDDDLIILFERESKDVEASFRISAQITGQEYPWWEKPFIGLHVAWWYLFIFGIPIVILFIIVGCVLGCACLCCKGKCCCDCCNYCNCLKCWRCCRCCRKKQTKVSVSTSEV